MEPLYSYSPSSSLKNVVLPRPLRPMKPSFQRVSSCRLTSSKMGSKLDGQENDRCSIWINAKGHPSFAQKQAAGRFPRPSVRKAAPAAGGRTGALRSEERRVGKEGRSG